MSHSWPTSSWPTNSQEAIALQQTLRSQVILTDDLGPITHVAGTDVGFEESGQITRAAVAVLTFPGLVLVDQAVARLPTTFPYVPGLLSFRELPAVLEALQQLTLLPDLLLCDGQGYAHPRRLGIACHLGVLTGLPTIGVGKSRLLGSHGEVPIERGAWTPLLHRDKANPALGEATIGAVLRSRPNTQPLFISQGHRIALPTALHYVMACTTRYRLPETTRWAHRLASGPPSQKARE